MNKPQGKKVPGAEAQAGIDAYRQLFAATPYYRESISYTIAELRNYLDEVEKELMKMRVDNVDDRCVSLIPYISQKDKRLSVLFTASIYKANSGSGNGKFKHRFNKKVKGVYGNEGGKSDPATDTDPDNPYNGVPDPTDPYNHGSGQP